MNVLDYIDAIIKNIDQQDINTLSAKEFIKELLTLYLQSNHQNYVLLKIHWQPKIFARTLLHQLNNPHYQFSPVQFLEKLPAARSPGQKSFLTLIFLFTALHPKYGFTKTTRLCHPFFPEKN